MLSLTARAIASLPLTSVQALDDLLRRLGDTDVADALWRYTRLAPTHPGALADLAHDCLSPVLRNADQLLSLANELDRYVHSHPTPGPQGTTTMTVDAPSYGSHLI